MPRRYWSTIELNILKEFYKGKRKGKITARDIGDVINRSDASIRRKACLLGYTKFDTDVIDTEKLNQLRRKMDGQEKRQDKVNLGHSSTDNRGVGNTDTPS